MSKLQNPYTHERGPLFGQCHDRCKACLYDESARAVIASLRAEGSEVADFYADKYERELESATTGDEGSEGRG